jgi:hypothetical protein
MEYKFTLDDLQKIRADHDTMGPRYAYAQFHEVRNMDWSTISTTAIEDFTTAFYQAYNRIHGNTY